MLARPGRRNPIQYSKQPRTVVPAALITRALPNIVPPKTEGTGNAGCLSAPAALRVRIENTQVSHHRFAEHSGIPCANGFNGFLRALPGDRLFDSHILEPQSGAIFNAAEGFEA
jgi:hypothetical protein